MPDPRPAPARHEAQPHAPFVTMPPAFPPRSRPSSPTPSPTVERAGAAGAVPTAPGAVPTAPGAVSSTPGAVPSTPGWSAATAEPEASPEVTGRGRRWPVVLLAFVTVVLAGSVVYLWRTSDAWEQRADGYQAISTDLGAELADTIAELDATTTELEAVSTQLATAQTRIIELANEKAQISDDREAQRLLVDYQERVSDAAGRVALALDQCVRGQNQLIGYLENAEQYEPEDLKAYEADVQDLCQAATDANTALQSELSR